MSGPPYPLINQAGSNGIGQYVIGVSPIGDISPFNYWPTVISQYANSPIITSLVASFFAELDQTANFDLFFDNIWNVMTAQGRGLDIWGRIVGLSAGRIVQVPAFAPFGFKESGTAVGFGQGPFYGTLPLTANYFLTDDQFLRLILAKALTNISNGSVPSLNRILLTLFPGRGLCYVQDGIPPQTSYFGFSGTTTSSGFGQAPFYSAGLAGGMTIVYVFNFQLTAVDLAIMNSGVLPKPLGVSASISII